MALINVVLGLNRNAGLDSQGPRRGNILEASSSL